MTQNQQNSTNGAVVWVKDSQEVFTKAKLLSTEKDPKDKKKSLFKVIKLSTNEQLTVTQYMEANPPTFDKVNDLSELTYLNEPSVLYNLMDRYSADMIYTYSGLFLVAINPYQNLKLYTKDYINLYNKSPKEDNNPHIFAIAEEAYQNLLNYKQNQSILVTGESGAGKTENTKKILQYLASVTSHELVASTQTSMSETQPEIVETFEQKILKSNPILESFGNAQTVKNNNSSRFGKFIKIEFDEFGKINGAHIDWYLLEKSRITLQNKNERNYHIFYQLLAGLKNNQTLNKQLATHLEMTKPNQYTPQYWKYLQNSNYAIPGVDDSLEFQDLVSSFNVVGFTPEEQTHILEIISVILHLGNIEFSKNVKDVQAQITSDIKPLVRLLGVEEKSFTKAILSPRSKAGKEFVFAKKTSQQCTNIVNSLSKIIYEKLFDHIVLQINKSLDHGSMTENYIGLLDIAGFEIFDNNSFEQLLINYTNENLQQFFNHHMFVLEQNEYIKENIQWDYVDYGQDLQTTIDLIEKPPTSLLSLLDEESIIPNSTDTKFYDRLLHSCSKSDRFKHSKNKQMFILKHYAGDVEYNVQDWLHKNKEPLNDHLVEVLSSSSKSLVKQFFGPAPQELETQTNKKSITTKFKTQAQRHKHQLKDLLTNLTNTNPLFVRCIIPNTKKKAKDFDKQLVLDQLRCNGVLEGIRISREGYPNRIFFKEFFQRYKLLVDEFDNYQALANYHNKEKIHFVKNNTKKNCELILSSLHLDPYLFKVGNTKLFFKAGVLANIEQMKQQKLSQAMTLLNAVIKGNQVRLVYKNRLDKINAAAILSSTFQHYNELSKNHWYKLFVNIKPMLTGDENGNQDKKNREYLKQIKILQEQLASNEAVKKELNNLNATLSKELSEQKELSSNKSEEMDNYKKVLDALEKKHLTDSKEHQKKIESLQTEYDQTVLKMTELQSKGISFDSTLADSKKMIETIKAEKSHLEKTIKTKERDLKRLLDDQKLTNSDKMQLLSQIDKLQKNELENNKKILALKKQLHEQDDDIDTKLQELERNFGGANKKLQKLVEENKGLRVSIASLKEENLEISNKLKQSQNVLEKLNERELSHQADVAKINKAKEEHFEQLNSVTAELKTLRNEHLQLKKDYDMLQEAYAQYKKNPPSPPLTVPVPVPTSEPTVDPIIVEKLHYLENQLHKEKLLNDYLHQKTLQFAPTGDDSLKPGSQGKESLESVEAQLKDCKHLLSKSIEAKEDALSRLKFLRHMLASTSIDNQVLKNQVKKLKEVAQKSLQNVDIDKLLQNVGTVTENSERLVLQLDNLKEELHREKTARADAEYYSNVLAEKFGKTHDLTNSNGFFGQLEQSIGEKSAFGIDGDERVVQYKKQAVKLQETINQYNGQVLKLNDELETSRGKERRLATELQAVQQDLIATEQQVQLYMGTIQDYKQQNNSITSTLLDSQNELREVHFELKRSTANIEKLQTVVKKLQSQNKMNEKLIWDKDNELADLEDDISSKEIDLRKLKHVNELLKSDVDHLTNSLQDFKKDQHYIDQINDLNTKLAAFSRNEIELTKEISSLKYNMDQLEKEADTKIQELIKQNEHYLSMASELSDNKTALEKNKTELETQIALMDKENEKLNGMIDKLTLDNSTLVNERNSLMAELDTRENEIEKELNSSTNMKNEVSTLKANLNAQNEQIKRNEEFLVKLNGNNQLLKESLDNLKEDYMDLEEENRALIQENRNYLQTQQNMEKRLNDPSERNLWMNKISDLEKKVDEESSLKFEELKKNKYLERELTELTEKLDQQSELLIIASKDREDFEKEANQSINKYTHLEMQLSAQATQNQNLQRENQAYVSRLEQLEQELKLWKQKYSVRS
ncbi:hypothetical protein ACO0RG_000873 [Hanseniaspora osmophila]